MCRYTSRNPCKWNISRATILFIGAHYEVKGSEITKYYFAGATRIAMRKYTIPQSMSVEYFLNDHLGSASITTDSTGEKVSEMRYNPWGEVRSAWTAELSTTPVYQLTKYTFTGQYSHMDDPTTENVTEGFGLMDYDARMYDPLLGRFTSADTIIPSTQGVQGWDRYAYVNNNPVRYSDPTGHIICAEVEVCNPGSGTQVGGGSGSTGSGSSSSGGNSGAVNDNDPDLCNTFGECGNTPSLDGMVNGNGPGLNMPSTAVNDECINWWEYCVTDISPDLMKAYWDVNVEINSIATWVGYGLLGITTADLALMALTYFGVLAIDPEPVSKTLLAIGGVAIAASFAAAFTASDVTNVNNAIVETGALSSGGKIIATPWSVTINSTSGKPQTVHTVLPGPQIALWVWVNSTLSP